MATIQGVPKAPTNWWKDFFTFPFYNPADKKHQFRAPKEIRWMLSQFKLPRGSAILDLCCGPGRHSILLAKNGYRVTGLDYSRAYLREAQKKSRRLGADVRWRHGNMKQLQFKAEFDAAINIYSSFGYFPTQKDNQKVLQGVSRALKPGGYFLLDSLHSQWLKNNYSVKSWQFQDDGYLLEERNYFPLRNHITTRWIKIFRDGKVVSKCFAMYLYDKAGISRMLRRAGLVPLRFWGGFDGSHLSSQSVRLIVLAQKPARQ